MMVFGKKCPACGSRRLAARLPATRLGGLPTARTYACEDCRQQLIYLFPVAVGVENRQFVRKQLPPFFLVRIIGCSNQYARIKNISEGGLCFDQHYNAAPIAGSLVTLDLYNCNDGSSLEQLSAEVIATFEQLLDVNGIKTTVLNHCARFVNLNQAQRKVLSNCISQYAVA